MSIHNIGLQTPVSQTSTPAERERVQAERVAREFEAMLLKQLTSSLNPSGDDEDADMFRSDANDMYRNMFSEQLAQSIAKNGGIGIADMLVDRMLAKSAAARQGDAPSGGNPFDADNLNSLVRELRAETHAAAHASPAASAPSASKSSTAKPSAPAPFASAPSNHAASDLASPAHADISRATRPRRVSAAASQFASPLRHAETPASLSESVALQMPVQGRITSGFGVRRHPVLGTHKHHGGVDIAAPRGTPIGAAAAGTVLFAGRQGAYGNTVVIQHADGRTTRYAHADRLVVKPGDTVSSGQTIATVGSTGRSTGPHLHFEVAEDDHRTDPLKAVINDLSLDRR